MNKYYQTYKVLLIIPIFSPFGCVSRETKHNSSDTRNIQSNLKNELNKSNINMTNQIGCISKRVIDIFIKYGVDLSVYKWEPQKNDIQYCLEQVHSDYKSKLFLTPPNYYSSNWNLSIAGKSSVDITCHIHSTFIVENDLLYFADYDDRSSGCTIAAFNLSSGKEIWRKPIDLPILKAHSLYSNKVNVEIFNKYLVVWGNEESLKYCQVLNIKNGDIIYIIIYRHYDPEEFIKYLKDEDLENKILFIP